MVFLFIYLFIYLFNISICSLGITLLELASDLDLPRGGDTWHQLRNGQLPDVFTQGLISRNNRVKSLVTNFCAEISSPSSWDWKKRDASESSLHSGNFSLG